MKGIEVVMLKWLLVVALVLGTPLAQAETSGLEQILREYHSSEASCQNMTLVKLASENADFTAKVVVLPFDAEACRNILEPIKMGDILKPLSFMLDKVGGISNSRIVRAVRQLVQEQRGKNLVKSLHVNAQPLADACKTLSAGREKDANVMCYFGGPSAESGKVFKVMFQAMLDHALPRNETVCTPERVTSKSASTKIFDAFLPDRTSALTWKQLQTSLKSDGFQCDQDECHQNIMGILLPKRDVLEETSKANGDPPFALILRQLAIYRGDWHRIGPGSCLIDKMAKATDDCSRAANGVQKGICLSSEDWHAWGLLIGGLNAFKN
jgi:hypothetical protein